MNTIITKHYCPKQTLIFKETEPERAFRCGGRILLLILLLETIFSHFFTLNAEKIVTVATIGDLPPVIKSDNKQDIVKHVINFWDKELKHVLKKKPDLIVLPEFCDLSSLGEPYLSIRKNQVLDFFASVSKKNQCYIAFGMQRMDEEGNWRNSCVIVGRNGEIAGIYDKNFPTIGEIDLGIEPSDNSQLLKLDFGKVAVAICFDLNFDELRAKYAKEKPDLIIFSSMYHGGVSQRLWAYSCESYFVGSVYRGYPSEIRDPRGDVVASSNRHYNYAIAKINLDFKRVHLAYNYVGLKALKDKYGSTVKISDPGESSSVIVTSENPAVSAEKMIREFDIVQFDDYLDQVREIKLEEGKH